MTTGNDDLNGIITKAQQFGLNCQVSQEGNQIIDLTENWQLNKLENEWLLSVESSPQAYLSDVEVLKFLEKHWESKLNNQDV